MNQKVVVVSWYERNSWSDASDGVKMETKTTRFTQKLQFVVVSRVNSFVLSTDDTEKIGEW